MSVSIKLLATALMALTPGNEDDAQGPDQKYPADRIGPTSRYAENYRTPYNAAQIILRAAKSKYPA